MPRADSISATGKYSTSSWLQRHLVQVCQLGVRDDLAGAGFVPHEIALRLLVDAASMESMKMSTATLNARAIVVITVRRRCRLRFRHAKRSRNVPLPRPREAAPGDAGTEVSALLDDSDAIGAATRCPP